MLAEECTSYRVGSSPTDILEFAASVHVISFHHRVVVGQSRPTTGIHDAEAAPRETWLTDMNLT